MCFICFWVHNLWTVQSGAFARSSPLSVSLPFATVLLSCSWKSKFSVDENQTERKTWSLTQVLNAALHGYHDDHDVWNVFSICCLTMEVLLVNFHSACFHLETIGSKRYSVFQGSCVHFCSWAHLITQEGNGGRNEFLSLIQCCSILIVFLKWFWVLMRNLFSVASLPLSTLEY